MSERYDAKRLRRERSAAIAAGAPATPVLNPTPAATKVTTPVPASSRLPDMLCRAHGQPWRSCDQCSITKAKS